MIDVRVGKIVKAWVLPSLLKPLFLLLPLLLCKAHPEADKLFCELIDVGESEPRPVASGLRAHYEITDLIGCFL
jgi:tRNA-binding EMAP/Myf-like protein